MTNPKSAAHLLVFLTHVQELFGAWCEIEKLEQIAPEDFRGIKAVEAVFRLTVK